MGKKEEEEEEKEEEEAALSSLAGEQDKKGGRLGGPREVKPRAWAFQVRLCLIPLSRCREREGRVESAL